MSSRPNSPVFDSSRVVREWITPAILIVAAILGARWAVVTDLNLLAAVTCILAGIALGTAIVSPKSGLYLLVFATGYLDFFKRYTVVTGMVNMRDIAIILAIAPLVFVCVIAGLISHAIFRRLTILPLDRKVIGVVLCVMSIGTLAIFRDTKSIEETLKAGANSIGYIPLLFVIGMVFRTPAETLRFLKHALFILLPVPLYAMWQQVFGPSRVEYEYLKTGLTITVGLLGDTRFRPFSTMASPHPASVCCAIFFILTLVPKRPPIDQFFPRFTWKWSWAGAIFLLGCIATFARAGWAVAALGLCAFFCFQYKLLTKLLYGISVAGLIVLIWNADWIENNLGTIESYLPVDSVIGEQAFRLGTFGDRLNGWRNILQTSGFVRPFGIPESERDESMSVHDQVGGFLLNFGYAGFLAVLFLLIWALVKSHTLIWKLTDLQTQRLAIGGLSGIFGVLVSGAIFGGHTSVFPVNVYFWLLAGTLFQTLTNREVATSVLPFETRSGNFAATLKHLPSRPESIRTPSESQLR